MVVLHSLQHIARPHSRLFPCTRHTLRSLPPPPRSRAFSDNARPLKRPVREETGPVETKREQSNWVFVGSLPHTASRWDVTQVLSQFGEIWDIRTGTGFARVQFADADAVKRALAANPRDLCIGRRSFRLEALQSEDAEPQLTTPAEADKPKPKPEGYITFHNVPFGVDESAIRKLVQDAGIGKLDHTMVVVDPDSPDLCTKVQIKGKQPKLVREAYRTLASRHIMLDGVELGITFGKIEDIMWQRR